MADEFTKVRTKAFKSSVGNRLTRRNARARLRDMDRKENKEEVKA